MGTLAHDLPLYAATLQQEHALTPRRDAVPVGGRSEKATRRNQQRGIEAALSRSQAGRRIEIKKMLFVFHHTDAKEQAKGNHHKTNGYGEDRSNGMLIDEPKNRCPMNR